MGRGNYERLGRSTPGGTFDGRTGHPTVICGNWPRKLQLFYLWTNQLPGATLWLPGLWNRVSPRSPQPQPGPPPLRPRPGPAPRLPGPGPAPRLPGPGPAPRLPGPGPAALGSGALLSLFFGTLFGPENPRAQDLKRGQKLTDGLESRICFWLIRSQDTWHGQVEISWGSLKPCTYSKYQVYILQHSRTSRHILIPGLLTSITAFLRGPWPGANLRFHTGLSWHVRRSCHFCCGCVSFPPSALWYFDFASSSAVSEVKVSSVRGWAFWGFPGIQAMQIPGSRIGGLNGSQVCSFCVLNHPIWAKGAGRPRGAFRTNFYPHLLVYIYIYILFIYICACVLILYYIIF